MKKYFYVLKMRFLGYRYHGWQKQVNVKTVQHLLDRNLKHLLEENIFKTLPASRTDSLVSANEHYCQIYAEQEITIDLKSRLNAILPDDMEVLQCTQVDKNFQIVGGAEYKEYHYFFANTAQKFPLAAPFMTFIREPLNINLMQEACALFKGEHHFKNYCYRPHEDKEFVRKIDLCQILENDLLTANFFPEQSFYLKVSGKGFFRHQIRLMMGALINAGRGEITLEKIQQSLREGGPKVSFVAPAAGLILHHTKFKELD